PPSTVSRQRAERFVPDGTRMRRTAVVLATNLIVGAAALVYLLHRFGTPAVLLLGRHRSIPFLLAFCGVVLVALAIDAWRWRVLLVGLGERPGMVRLAAFRAAGQSLSALLPSAKLGGEPVRMFLLARERVSAARAIASVAVDRTVELGTSTTAACVFAALLLRQGVPALGSVLLTLGLGTLGLGGRYRAHGPSAPTGRRPRHRLRAANSSRPP